jgi:hypothetical protein
MKKVKKTNNDLQNKSLNGRYCRYLWPTKSLKFKLFVGQRYRQYLPFNDMFCRSLFVFLSFFIWPLSCLSFYLRILITPLVYSNSSSVRDIDNIFHLTICLGQTTQWSNEKWQKDKQRSTKHIVKWKILSISLTDEEFEYTKGVLKSCDLFHWRIFRFRIPS